MNNPRIQIFLHGLVKVFYIYLAWFMLGQLNNLYKTGDTILAWILEIGYFVLIPLSIAIIISYTYKAITTDSAQLPTKPLNKQTKYLWLFSLIITSVLAIVLIVSLLLKRFL